MDTLRKNHYFPEISEGNFPKIFEAIPDSMVAIDQSGTIIFTNSQTQKLFGYSETELIGQKVELLMPQSFRERHIFHRDHYFHEPKIRPMGVGMQLYGQRKNGEIFSVDISLSQLETNNGIIALAAIRDNSERVKFEKMLQEKNIELERANYAKDRFLESMSHELRTPLNAIIGFTTTLLMQLPGDLNEEQIKQLSIVKKSAYHLLSLINDLLDLSKVEAGKIEFKKEKVVCQCVIKEASDTLAQLAKFKGLDFLIDVPKEDIVLKTDRRALSQIVINLANNAIKFTESGCIRIKLRKKNINNRAYVMIDVIDTGIGIKPDDQTRLFQAFQQISQEGKRTEGTGLGLYLTKKIVNLLNGQITLTSKYGKGSCFSIQIPIAE